MGWTSSTSPLPTSLSNSCQSYQNIWYIVFHIFFNNLCAKRHCVYFLPFFFVSSQDQTRLALQRVDITLKSILIVSAGLIHTSDIFWSPTTQIQSAISSEHLVLLFILLSNAYSHKFSNKGTCARNSHKCETTSINGTP